MKKLIGAIIALLAFGAFVLSIPADAKAKSTHYAVRHHVATHTATSNGVTIVKAASAGPVVEADRSILHTITDGCKQQFGNQPDMIKMCTGAVVHADQTKYQALSGIAVTSK